MRRKGRSNADPPVLCMARSRSGCPSVNGRQLDVKVAGYQPAIDETRVTEAEARFDPTFFTNVQYSKDNTLGPTINAPGHSSCARR